MQLQTTLGLSLMLTRGSNDGARVAFERGLEIAEQHNDARTQMRLMSMLHMFHGRVGAPRTALTYARRCAALSKSLAEPAARALGHYVLGMSLHFTGDLSTARAELEAALRYQTDLPPKSDSYFGFSGPILCGSALARTLWMQGYPAQAVERARQTVSIAASTDHPVTLSIALVWAITVCLWVGDLAGSEQYIEWFSSRAENYSLGPYRVLGRGFKQELAVRRGNAEDAVDGLRDCLRELHAARHELLITQFTMALVQGLVALGRFADGLLLIDEAIQTVAANGDHCYMPELLRVKGNILLALQPPGDDKAEMWLVRSVDLSRIQGARAWELRTSIDLAQLWCTQGQRERAYALLSPIRQQFIEGFESADLQAADRMLAALQ